MKDGLIYILAKFVVDNLNRFNLVELFKKLGEWANRDKNNDEKKRTYQRVAVDIFIILKWVFLLIIWRLHWVGLGWTIVIWYLLITNMHAYFYHHAWSDSALEGKYLDKHRVRRRFLNLFLALGFSDLCFAYLYRLPYVSHFSWGDLSSAIPTSLHATWFSISNSFAANYDVVKPITDPGNTVAMVQLLMTFVFITVIISRAIESLSESNNP